MRPPDWLGADAGAAQWRAWRLDLDALRARAGARPGWPAHLFGALLACPGAHPVWSYWKAHFFVEGRSLCRSWLFFGRETRTQSTSAERPGPDDCAACWRRLHRQEGRRGA